MLQRIYLDNAATTSVRKEVVEEMLPYFTTMYGNPSSSHFFGRETKMAIENARKQVAKAINAQTKEVYFTAGGSESDNWAIMAIVKANNERGKHIITTTIEHHAVLHACQHMQKDGYRVTYVPVDEFGMVKVEDVKNAICEDTVLITIMTANNEIGTIQPIAEIGEIAREAGILFHTDAVQAVGSIAIDVQELKVDMLSMSAHKLNGPKGIGALYIRKGVQTENLIFGAPQERGLRAGTENVPAIVGFGKTIELANAELEEHQKHLISMRERFIQGVLQSITQVRLNGHQTKRLPGNVNISFANVDARALLANLDLVGIAASGGSACTSGSLEASHVLQAIALPYDIARGSVRFSFGRNNTMEEVEIALEKLRDIVKKLRENNT